VRGTRTGVGGAGASSRSLRAGGRYGHRRRLSRRSRSRRDRVFVAVPEAETLVEAGVLEVPVLWALVDDLVPDALGLLDPAGWLEVAVL